MDLLWLVMYLLVSRLTLIFLDDEHEWGIFDDEDSLGMALNLLLLAEVHLFSRLLNYFIAGIVSAVKFLKEED